MEVTPEELLEQSKTSALEAALYKSRAQKASGFYKALYEKVKHASEDAKTDAQKKHFEFLSNFPETIEV